VNFQALPVAIGMILFGLGTILFRRRLSDVDRRARGGGRVDPRWAYFTAAGSFALAIVVMAASWDR
jgi:hypothetical protein